MPASDSRAATFRQLAFLLGCVWLGTLLFAVLRHVSGLLTERDFSSNPARLMVFVTTYFWLPWLVFAPLVAMIAKRLPIRPGRWLGPLSLHALALLAISVAHGMLAAYLYYYFGNVNATMHAYAPWQHSGHFLFGDNMFMFDTITYAVLAANLNIGSFHRLLRHQELDAIRLRGTLTELRLQTLRMQINPHFLFNSLNAVSVLVHKNERERAIETISRIASFFRRTLEGSGEQWVPLKRELQMAAEYLAIARVRYGQRLNVVEECEPAVKDVPVPAMLLQPLIENAVIHGIAEKPGACALHVRCRPVHDRLVIEITDDGAGSALRDDPHFREGVGLTNVRLRLQQLYGEDHAFSIESRPGEGTRVAIAVPRVAPAAAQALAV